MTSGVPWQAKGVRREAMETAREAARRSGMSVAEWLDTVIAESAREAGVEPVRRAAPSSPRGEPEDARDWRRQHSEHDEHEPLAHNRELSPILSEVSARLDRLSRQVDDLAPSRRQSAAANSPEPIDQALAEIEARQRALDGEMPASRMEFARAPTQRLPDLEHQLRQLNARMDAMRPCGIDNAVETLRDDLAEIGVMLKDAVPRQAIEALEIEVRSLTARIDDKRHAGADHMAMEGLERGLAEVRDALRTFTPAENLVGFGETVHDLSRKIDRLADSGQDPAAIKQLEGAILALRGVVSQVASDEALMRLSDEVRTLSAKIDQVTASDAFSALEQRIAVMAELLQSHEVSSRDVGGLDAAMANLSEKIDHFQSTRSDFTAATHLEDRIAQLVERLDETDARHHQFEAIERGLAELLIYIDTQRAAAAERQALESSESSALKRDVQRTQDALESLHGALGQVIDRLAMIESSIRDAQLPRAANSPQTSSAAASAAWMDSSRASIPPLAPAIPEPAAVPPVTPSAPVATTVPPVTPNLSPASDHPPIDPNLPPDHPLEPGVARARGNSPADRIAASEAALEDVRPPVIPDPGGKPNFIAAARRAAQAAMVEAPPPKEKPSAGPKGLASSAAASFTGKSRSTARKLMVGVGLLLLILGSVHFVATKIWFSGASKPESAAQATRPDAPSPTPASRSEPASTTPAIPDRESALMPAPGFGVPPGPHVIAVGPQNRAPAAQASDREATGSIQPNLQAALVPAPLPQPSPVRENGADRLPAGIGSAALRSAAMNGDAAAEFEIASRFAEGRGVPQNLAEAAFWFERAASKGLVPAQFRLGGLYEKGLGVRKDAETARRYYLAAAEAGNAKAMHNLAVLFAEGGGSKPDYAAAARWFRRAADHGMIDSQYNLAILYARGIGVETNLAEAFKWFALASREGDHDAGRKRDDIAGRLDKESLQAAMAAAQAWQPQAQPDAAVQVTVPAGGWDAPPPSTAKRRVGPKAEMSPRPAQ